MAGIDGANQLPVPDW